MLSIPKYRDFLGLSPQNDEDIADLKAEVEELWISTTQRLWKAETGRVEVHRVEGKRITTLFPHLRPVTSITKIEVKSELGGPTDWDELLIADEGWELIDNQIIRYGTWWKPLVRVTYNGGYAIDSCPADVKRALKVQAKFTRERMDTEVKMASVSSEGGSGSLVTPNAHPYFTELAADYRRLV